MKLLLILALLGLINESEITWKGSIGKYSTDEETFYVNKEAMYRRYVHSKDGYSHQVVSPEGHVSFAKQSEDVSRAELEKIEAEYNSPQ